MLAALSLRVECYAGHRGEESPRRFWIGERAIEVVEEIDRWLSPDHRYFKVRGDDGDLYVLRHDPEDDHWELTLFQRGEPPLHPVRPGGPDGVLPPS
ncbi:MAG: hypothetical protein ACM3OB_07135 [Acidobacteriota bacterium]